MFGEVKLDTTDLPFVPCYSHIGLSLPLFDHNAYANADSISIAASNRPFVRPIPFRSSSARFIDSPRESSNNVPDAEGFTGLISVERMFDVNAFQPSDPASEVLMPEPTVRRPPFGTTHVRFLSPSQSCAPGVGTYSGDVVRMTPRASHSTLGPPPSSRSTRTPTNPPSIPSVERRIVGYRQVASKVRPSSLGGCPFSKSERFERKSPRLPRNLSNLLSPSLCEMLADMKDDSDLPEQAARTASSPQAWALSRSKRGMRVEARVGPGEYDVRPPRRSAKCWSLLSRCPRDGVVKGANSPGPGTYTLPDSAGKQGVKLVLPIYRKPTPTDPIPTSRDLTPSVVRRKGSRPTGVAFGSGLRRLKRRQVLQIAPDEVVEQKKTSSATPVGKLVVGHLPRTARTPPPVARYVVAAQTEPRAKIIGVHYYRKSFLRRRV